MCLQYREDWISDGETSFSREMNPHRKTNLEKTIRLGIGITGKRQLGYGLELQKMSLGLQRNLN